MDSGKKGYLLFKWLILINVYISIFYFLCLNIHEENQIDFSYLHTILRKTIEKKVSVTRIL